MCLKQAQKIKEYTLSIKYTKGFYSSALFPESLGL